jgi:hypothetical protein
MEDSTMSEGKTTTDHDEIRQWAEERGGVPSTVTGTERSGKKGAEHAGILRLDFEPHDEGLEEISWDEFFEKFDKEKLAFLYQEETAGGDTSRFHKFINRSTANQGGAAKSGGSSAKSAKSSSGRSGGAKSSSAKSEGASKSAGRKKTSASKS